MYICGVLHIIYSYYASDGVLYKYYDLWEDHVQKREKLLCKYPPSKPGETYYIPNGVRSIGYKAFDDCKYLKKVFIPSSVDDMDDIPLNIVCVVERGSYAEDYCKTNNLNFEYR